MGRQKGQGRGPPPLEEWWGTRRGEWWGMEEWWAMRGGGAVGYGGVVDRTTHNDPVGRLLVAI